MGFKSVECIKHVINLKGTSGDLNFTCGMTKKQVLEWICVKDIVCVLCLGFISNGSAGEAVRCGGNCIPKHLCPHP